MVKLVSFLFMRAVSCELYCTLFSSAQRYVFFFQLPWFPELLLRSGDYSFLANCFLKKPFGVTSGVMTEDDVEAYKYTFGRE